LIFGFFSLDLRSWPNWIRREFCSTMGCLVRKICCISHSSIYIRSELLISYRNYQQHVAINIFLTKIC